MEARMIYLICYHKNADKIYPKEWIDKFRDSVLNQTFKGFKIYENNYGGDDFRIFENSRFESKIFPTFVHSMNYLIDKCFSSGAEYVGNLNCDDWYAENRIQRQLQFLEKGYDIVSSNFILIKDDKEVHRHKFHYLNIRNELSKDHNIIGHPVVCYSKRFWQNNRYIPEEIPREDLNLWQRSINNSRFIILKDNLLFHRIHENSVCQSENR